MLLAYLGNKVTVVDANVSRIDDLKQGKIPFFEPGLAQLVASTTNNNLLEFTEDLVNAVKKSRIIFIAVGTPPLATGEPDLSQVTAVASEIGSALDTSYKRIVVNKSTVPVGSGNWVEMLVSQGITNKEKSKLLAVAAGRVPEKAQLEALPQFTIVSNPEFLREGSAIADSFYPDRIVIGSNDDSATSLMKELYQPILEQSFKAPPFLKDTPTHVHSQNNGNSSASTKYLSSLQT